jgi:hypothetical protein
MKKIRLLLEEATALLYRIPILVHNVDPLSYAFTVQVLLPGFVTGCRTVNFTAVDVPPETLMHASWAADVSAVVIYLGDAGAAAVVYA